MARERVGVSGVAVHHSGDQCTGFWDGARLGAHVGARQYHHQADTDFLLWLLGGFVKGFEVHGFWVAVLGALILSAVSSLTHWVLHKSEM